MTSAMFNSFRYLFNLYLFVEFYLAFTIFSISAKYNWAMRRH